ncbi:MAG: NADH-quinone oxidoreductase subunit N [Acidobacteriaceae bacterium]
MSPNVLALLPELILTLAGVLIMLVEPLLRPSASRKPLGWVAIAGTLLAGAASWYQLGFGTTRAFSGTIQVDAFSVFFHLLIAAVVVVTLLTSLDYFEGSAATPGSSLPAVATNAGEYFALNLFAAVGMMLMTSAVELLVVFVGLEISSIATYILCGFRKGKATGSESSLKYFLLGSFATAFFLYGIALAFGATGSTSIGAIAAALPTTATPRLAFMAVAMILIGLGFKVSAAPFHVWTPDVYQGAPAPVVGLMSTAPKAAAFAVLLRILFSGFPAMQHRWSALLWVVAALSMCIGNLGALLQRDVKRMLAYSSIAHAGYLLVAFTAFPADGIAAACFYTAAYAAMNVGAFAVIAQVSGYEEPTRTIEDFTGLALKRPVLSALLAFFLLSLIGIPFTGGFFGKFYVFTAALHAGKVWLAVIGLLNSGVACFYYLRLLAAVYSRPAAIHAAPVTSAFSTRGLAHPEPLSPSPTFPRGVVSVPAGIGLAIAAAATLILGILPSQTLWLAQYASFTARTESARSECAARPELCQGDTHLEAH